MTDLHDRCDQYAVRLRTGKLVVFMSYISLLTLGKGLLKNGSLGALVL
jgi:hypothetical protein